MNRLLAVLILALLFTSNLRSESIIHPDSSVTAVDQVNIIEVKRVRRVASFWSISGSNAVPLSFAGKFITGGYISPKSISTYEALLSADNRMGVATDYFITAYPLPYLVENKKENALKQISMGVKNFAGARFTKDAFGLFFRGNAPYIGSLKELGTNELSQISQRYLRFCFEPKGWDKGKWIRRFDVQFSQVLNYSKAETQGLAVTTDKNIDSVVLSGDMYYQSTGYQFGGTGWGLQLNTDWVYRAGTHSYAYFSLSNFGFLSVNGVKTVSRGYQWDPNSLKPINSAPSSTLNIKSVALSGKELKVSNWFDRQRDSIESKLGLTEIDQRGTVLSPFFINMGYSYQKFPAKLSGFLIQADYLHVPGYIPRLAAKLIWNPMRNLVVKPGVSIGGFDVFDINASVQINGLNLGRRSIFFDFFLNGIESFIAPNKYHGGGGGLQISYPFDS